MNKFLLSVATCSILASSAFAQVTTNTTATSNEKMPSAPMSNESLNAPNSSNVAPVTSGETTNPTPVMTPDMNSASTVTNSTPVVGTATVESIPATPVVTATEPVNTMPGIDQSFFNSLVDSFNSKNVDSIMSSMSVNDIIFVTSTGVVIKDKEAIKNHLIAMMTGENPISLSLSVNDKVEPKPGVAFTAGTLTKSLKTAPDSNEIGETQKETISALLSYENNEWKIVALQSTKVEEPKPLEPAHEEKSQSSGLRTLLALVLGAAAGFMGARFMAKKSAQA